MTERLYIGALARRTGRSVHTIRWYEAQGLLPGVVREPGGRRVYHPDHVDHLVFLNWLRRTGMSITEMRAITTLSLQGWRTLGDARSPTVARTGTDTISGTAHQAFRWLESELFLPGRG